MFRYILFIIILFSWKSANSQILTNTVCSKIDSLLAINKIAQVKSMVSEFELHNLSEIEKYKLLQFKVRISQKENDEKSEVKYMTEYLLNQTLDSVLIEKWKNSLPQRQNDTSIIYLTKSNYSRVLVHIYLKNNDYKAASKYLTIHESKFPIVHRCGNGAATDRVKKQILHSRINQLTENHDSVLIRLLPLNFKYALGLTVGESTLSEEIDLLLLNSLNAKFSKKEILQEFERCLNALPIAKRPITGYITKMKMFGITFNDYTIEVSAQREERKQAIYLIEDKTKREKLRQEIYLAFYKQSIKKMRIYKKIFASN